MKGKKRNRGWTRGNVVPNPSQGDSDTRASIIRAQHNRGDGEIAKLWIPPLPVLGDDMEQVCFWSNCYLFRMFSFQEVLDWRFIIHGDFLLVSFVNCT
uniref:Uncharacterized protein n=4 Tax=Gossypium TaxID=3633 RepID=A0A0D2QN48_GOSRA|nr:hypothetical protein B456_003G187000 [Gossypium raimondii]